MNRNNPDILDLLAAEFVLGTLAGLARRRFARWRDSDPFVDRRVRAWEERLAGLAFRLEPVAPSPAVWASIERRIGPAQHGRWRALAAAVAVVAFLGLGWLLWQGIREPTPLVGAVIATETGETLWRVELAVDGRYVDIRTIGIVRYPALRSLELWALPPEAAPVSLGVLPARGRQRLMLDERQRAAIGIAANVVVSEEPYGGSPTGSPTGPVLYVAAVARS